MNTTTTNPPLAAVCLECARYHERGHAKTCSKYVPVFETINDWHPETRSLLKRLIFFGFTIVSADCGEGEPMKYPGKITKAFLDECDCCDES